MFWAFKLSFVVDLLNFFWLGNFLGYFLKKLAIFSNLLVTLAPSKVENSAHVSSIILSMLLPILKMSGCHATTLSRTTLSCACAVQQQDSCNSRHFIFIVTYTNGPNKLVFFRGESLLPLVYWSLSMEANVVNLSRDIIWRICTVWLSSFQDFGETLTLGPYVFKMSRFINELFLWC